MSETKTSRNAKDTLQVPQDTLLPSESEDDRPIDSQRLTRSKKVNLCTTMPELDLNILLKFIKPYDGSRETLNSFIINCNNAYELATTSQKPIIFKYILCQLHGKAEVACSIKEFQNWEQLKEFLKTQFSERKHYSHLLMELQESKQLPNENTSKFALKIETHLSQLLTEITLNNSKAKELPGRIAAMEELALHHFLVGLQPRISNIVRCKSPKTLNEAINYAVSEERIQETLYKRNAHTDYKPRTRPNPTFPNPITRQPTPSRPSDFQRQYFRPREPVICRYCKFPGHSIEQCRKREFNNRLKNSNNLPSSSPAARVHFLPNPDEGHDEVDNNDLNA